MKKILLAVVCVMMTTTTFAQRAMTTSTSFFSSERSDQPITFGIRAGLNFANMSFGEDGYRLTPNSKTGFNLGLSADIPVLESFYIQSGLYYSTKGCSIEDEIDFVPAYLDIPVLASYRYNVSESAQIQLNVGPYFAYGIGGKAKYEDGDRVYKEDFFGEDSDAKRFDYGLQIGAGLTFGKIYVGCAYQIGMANILDDDDDSIKNKNFLINVGFNF